MITYGLCLLVSAAKTELAEPSTENKSSTREEDVAHLTHISIEFSRQVHETGL